MPFSRSETSFVAAIMSPNQRRGMTSCIDSSIPMVISDSVAVQALRQREAVDVEGGREEDVALNLPSASTVTAPATRPLSGKALSPLCKTKGDLYIKQGPV
jgi:hypothetical protein